MTPARSPLWLVAALLALCTLLQFTGLEPLLRYSRSGIEAGEAWRLLTANLVHLGPSHLLLNAIGTALVATLVGMHLRPLAWAGTWTLCALAVGAGLWWARPDLEWYVGLSGVLHGLLVAGALAGLANRRERRFTAIVLVAVAAKLAWEQWRGALPGTAAAAGGAVVVDAHLFGAAGGMLAGVLVLAWGRIRRGRDPDARR